MIFSDLLAALKARWRLELAILVGVLLLVMAWTFVSPKTYTAQATLLFDSTAPDPKTEATSEVKPDMAEIINTQIEVMKSQEVAAEVSRRLGLANDPRSIANWRKATGGIGDLDSWLGANLLGGLKVEPSRGSTVLEVSYRSSDPQFAASVANTFVQAYLATQLRMTTDPAKAYTRWFEDRSREVRENLERAQNRLADFQRQKGIVSNETFDAESNRLTALASQLAGAEGQLADASARAGANSGASPDVQSSGVVQGLRTEIAQKAAQVSQLETVLGPNHPDMISARAELAELRAKLRSEVGASSHSLNVASGDAVTRAASLRSLVEAQRQRMLALSADRSQLEVLQRDVASARAAFDNVTQRLSAMRLQSALPRTNIRPLDTATPPIFPSSPNVGLRVLIGLALGAMLALTIAALLEWIRPRVRTSVGIERGAGVPVLMMMDLQQSRVGAMLEREAA